LEKVSEGIDLVFEKVTISGWKKTVDKVLEIEFNQFAKTMNDTLNNDFNDILIW
jgi:hypothetical protein